MLVRIHTQLSLLESRRKIEQQAKELKELNNLKDKLLESIGNGVKETLNHFAQNTGEDKISKQENSIDELIGLLNELKLKMHN